MRRRRHSEAQGQSTRSGVDLAVQYGYSAAAKAGGKANGGNIRSAYPKQSGTYRRPDREP
jgi:hypothetical protein